MKKIALLLGILFTLPALAQSPVTVVLVGTIHQFQDSLLIRQNLTAHLARMMAYAPQQIFIEAIPPSDSVGQSLIYGSAMRVARQLPKGAAQLRTLDSLCALLDNTTDSVRLRYIHQTIGNEYYQQHDFWNAYYHWFSLAGKGQADTNPLFDSLQRSSFRHQKHTEFGNLVFPLASQLRMCHLVNFDERTDDAAFQRLGKHVMKRLIINLKLFKALKTLRHLRQQLTTAERAGRLLEEINGDSFQRQVAEIIDHVDQQWVKTRKATLTRQLWEKRNQRMAERISTAIQLRPSSRVMVFVGAAHVEYLRRALAKNKTLNVKLYREL